MFGSYFQIQNNYYVFVRTRLHIITVGKNFGSYLFNLGLLEKRDVEMEEKNVFQDTPLTGPDSSDQPDSHIAVYIIFKNKGTQYIARL